MTGISRSSPSSTSGIRASESRLHLAYGSLGEEERGESLTEVARRLEDELVVSVLPARITETVVLSGVRHEAELETEVLSRAQHAGVEDLLDVAGEDRKVLLRVFGIEPGDVLSVHDQAADLPGRRADAEKAPAHAREARELGLAGDFHSAHRGGRLARPHHLLQDRLRDPSGAQLHDLRRRQLVGDVVRVDLVQEELVGEARLFQLQDRSEEHTS